MRIRETAKACYKLACDKGFHTPGKRVRLKEELAVFTANLHTEVSEMWEAYREGKIHQFCNKASKMMALGFRPLTCLEEELADIVIRALAVAEHFGINIEEAITIKHAYNKSRPYKHGNKRA